MTFNSQQTLTAAALNLAVQPGTIIARGKRTTDSSTTTTEIGVLRIDGVALTAGRLYMIYTGVLLPDGNTNDNNIGCRLRYSTSGTATTASTQLHQSNYDQDVQTATEAIAPLKVSYTPAANETLSVLLTVAAFSGAPTVSLLAAATYPVELFIEDKGLDPGDTGVDI